MLLENYTLVSNKKNYFYDQEKFIDPNKTYEKTLKKLQEVFPKKNFKLNKIKSDDFHIFEFGDERLVAKGKGFTLEQSKASAIMEYVERLSWLEFDFLNRKEYLKISFNNLNKKENLDSLKPFFNNLLMRGDSVEFKENLFDVKLDWIKGYSLFKKELSYYPVGLNNMGQTSNGLASGNIKEEAILQALCELVERHNLNYFLSNFNELKLKLIDQQNIDNLIIQDLILKLKKQNIDIYLVDISYDLEVPSIMVCGVNKNKDDTDFGYISYGYGTQANPEFAIIRAITEYIQMNELNEIYDGNNEYLDNRKNISANFQYTLNIDILEKISKNSKLSGIETLNDLSNIDFKIELENIFTLFEDKDYDLVLIDKTIPKLGIPVYRVWSPQIYPFIKFESNLNNFYLFLMNVFFQSQDLELSKTFFNKYFDKIVFNEMDPQTDLLFQANPYLTRDLILRHFDPEKVILANLFPETYLDYLRGGCYK